MEETKPILKQQVEEDIKEYLNDSHEEGAEKRSSRVYKLANSTAIYKYAKLINKTPYFVVLNGIFNHLKKDKNFSYYSGKEDIVVKDLKKDIKINDFNKDKYRYRFNEMPNNVFAECMAEKKKIVPISNRQKGEIFFYNNSWRGKNKGKNDLQVYISDDQTLYLKHTFSSKEFEKDGSLKVNNEHCVKLMIAPNGKADEAISLFRYDNDDDGKIHKNSFLFKYIEGNLKRRYEEMADTFGERVEYPHFHFQNLTQNLLTTRKGDISYKARRCNAIDVSHLCKYLKKIQNLSLEELKTLDAKGRSFGMPFLAILIKLKEEGKEKLECKKIEEINSVMSKKSRNYVEVGSILTDFYIESAPYNHEKGPFEELIEKLYFLKYVNKMRKNRTIPHFGLDDETLKKRNEAYRDFEALLVDSLVDEFFAISSERDNRLSLNIPFLGSDKKVEPKVSQKTDEENE